MTANTAKCDQLWKKRRYRGASDLFVDWKRTNRADIDIEDLSDNEEELRIAQELLRNFRGGRLANIAGGGRANFPEANLFPCFLANNLKLGQVQGDLNRRICSTNTIPFNQKVFQEKPFAIVVEPSPRIFCLTCHNVPETQQDAKSFIKCTRLGCDAVFCQINCRDSNQTHKFECGTFFRNITDLDIACTIQMLFETMTIFVSAEVLLNHIENLVRDEITHGTEQRRNVIRMQIPQRANDKISKFDCIMRLQNGESSTFMCYRVDIALELMESIDSIGQYFKTPAQKRLLRHLAQHFFGIIVENAWKSRLRFGPNPNDHLKRCMIYPVGSYFNHSCAPDLLVRTEGNEMVLISLYQIPTNTEVFINYQFFYDDDTVSRRRYMKASWGFVCECTRCSGHDVSADDRIEAQLAFERANRGRRPNEHANLNTLVKVLKRKGFNPRNGGRDLAYLLEFCNNY